MAKPFGSSLTDDQWEAIKTLFPVQRRRLHHPRQILDALLYLVKTGCQWRYLPPCFPPWTAVYYHFRRWKATGRLRRAHDAIRALVRTRKGRKSAASLGLLDSQSVKTTMLGGVRGFDAGKKIKGRKRHVLVDTMGFIIALVVHSAAVSDGRGAVEVLRRATSQRLCRVIADAGYASVPGGLVWRLFGWIFEVVRRSRKGFEVMPKRWIVERTFAWFGGYRRLSKDYERQCATSEAIIHLTMIRIMLNRR